MRRPSILDASLVVETAGVVWAGRAVPRIACGAMTPVDTVVWRNGVVDIEQLAAVGTDAVVGKSANQDGR